MDRGIEARTITYRFFEQLKPGEVIVVSKVAQRDPKGFVEMAKEYIDQGGFIEFSSDYRKIRGLEPINWLALKLEIPGPYIIPD